MVFLIPIKFSNGLPSDFKIMIVIFIEFLNLFTFSKAFNFKITLIYYFSLFFYYLIVLFKEFILFLFVFFSTLHNIFLVSFLFFCSNTLFPIFFSHNLNLMKVSLKHFLKLYNNLKLYLF